MKSGNRYIKYNGAKSSGICRQMRLLYKKAFSLLDKAFLFILIVYRYYKKANFIKGELTWQ